MRRKGLVAALVAIVLALVAVPNAAYAITPESSAKNLSECSIKFTDSAHKCDDTQEWQMYFVKGKTKAASPKFSLYYNGTKVPASAYTVSYKLTWWGNDDQQHVKNWTKSLVPQTELEGNYQIVCKAKKDSGYTGTYDRAEIVVNDFYAVGHYTGVYFTKAKSSWRHNINPMNSNYFVIPQSSIKATLSSFTLYAGSSPIDGGMAKDGTKIPTTKYTKKYYKAKKNIVGKNLWVEDAIVGSALSSAPKTAGSFIMVAKGKSPFYGKVFVVFDIQDKMANVEVKKVSNKKYTGKAIKPALTVTYNGVKLKQGSDYKVTYKNNVKKGTATAIISGCNKIKTNTRGKVETLSADRFFTGTKTITFKIV
ncbi:MAG: hypothetical protein Q4A07_11295 [Coriobacteriales bacterium]|nr:hypothetical protein [Coriobacteriales bacterium]